MKHHKRLIHIAGLSVDEAIEYREKVCQSTLTGFEREETLTACDEQIKKRDIRTALVENTDLSDFGGNS